MSHVAALAKSYSAICFKFTYGGTTYTVAMGVGDGYFKLISYGTVVATVIQAAIDVVNTAFLAGNGGGLVICKGYMVLASTIWVKQGCDFYFDILEFTNDENGLLKVIGVNQLLRIVGRELIAPTNFSKIAFWVYDCYLLDVNIQEIIVKTGYGAGGSIGLKLLGESNSVTTMYNNFRIQAIDSFETGIALVNPGYSSGSVNCNDFYDTKITGWVSAVILDKLGTGEISYNNFYGIKAWAPVGGGVRTGFSFTGATNNLANNFFGCQVSDTAATDVALNLSAGAIVNWYGGNFDGGMLTPVINLGLLRIHDVFNYVTENRVAATITALNTSIVFAHGCNYTPAAGDIHPTLTNLPTADIGDVYVDTIGAVNATLHCRNPPGVATAIFDVSIQRTP